MLHKSNYKNIIMFILGFGAIVIFSIVVKSISGSL